MNKISSNPYERPPGSFFEGSRDGFDRPPERELTQEEKLEKERKLSERQQEVIESYRYAVNLANYHSGIENKTQVFTNEKYNEFLSLPHYTFGDSSLFLDRLRVSETNTPVNTLQLNNSPALHNILLNNPPKKEIINIAEKPHTPRETLSEKEKVTEYAVLSNLAYARFDRVNRGGGTDISNLRIKEVNLDVAGIDFTKFRIENDGRLSAIDKNNVTPDEDFILSYFNNNQNNFQEHGGTVITDTDDRNITNIVDLALVKSRMSLTELAKKTSLNNTFAKLGTNEPSIPSASEGHNFNIPDITEEAQRIQRFTEFIQNNRPRFNEALLRLKASKTSEYQQQFDSFKKKGEFKILAHYPEEGSTDTSGFQCVLFEKNGKKILSIAGTQLNGIINADKGDLGADWDILHGRLPEAQTRAMIEFFKKNKDKLPPNSEFVIVGHSLGGTLAQIGTSIYGSSESYTFNSPGAKNLEVSIKPDDPYQEELRDFTNNRNSDTIAERITNVKGTRGLSFIAEKGVDIGNYRINLDTSYHSISSIIEAIEKVDKLAKSRVEETKKNTIKKY